MNKTTTALKDLNTREVCSHHFFTTGESAISYQTACGFVVSFLSDCNTNEQDLNNEKRMKSCD